MTDLTDEEIKVAHRAAARWGYTDEPSFGDIIDELTPDYACKGDVQRGYAVDANKVPCRDRAQIERWHRVKNYAITLVPEELRDGRPLHQRVSGDPTKPSKKRRKLCPACSINYMSASAKTCRPCAASEIKKCERDGCEEPSHEPRGKFCSRKCQRIAQKAAEKPECKRDGCNERVKQRQSKYCSHECWTRHLRSSRIKRECYKCSGEFVTDYTSDQRYCKSCRGRNKKTVGATHDYGFAYEHLPRRLG